MYHNRGIVRGPDRSLSEVDIPISARGLARVRDKVTVALKGFADVLCPYHDHRVCAAHLPPGLNYRWYTLTVPCREKDIAWKMEIYPDCKLRSVARCKKVDLTISPPDRPSRVVKFYQPRLVWGEYCCNEILAWIKEDAGRGRWWWLDEDLLKDNQPVNALPNWGELDIYESDTNEEATETGPPHDVGDTASRPTRSPQNSCIPSAAGSEDLSLRCGPHLRTDFSDNSDIPSAAQRDDVPRPCPPNAELNFSDNGDLGDGWGVVHKSEIDGVEIDGVQERVAGLDSYEFKFSVYN
ncbi:hypothetical protein HOY80DRAFT_1085856 [Tuber brumale]|nr:hypothetical protein HOY80DRAFT_1085856 [Tuber brumale]